MNVNRALQEPNPGKAETPMQKRNGTHFASIDELFDMNEPLWREIEMKRHDVNRRPILTLDDSCLSH
jgi:hypothetical protein